MNICVVGTGYVGLVTGAVFADLGNDIVCVDKDRAKSEALRAGRMPIYEPGLEEMVARNVDDRRLSFTTDMGAGIRHADVIFIAVGTPPKDTGETDLSQVEAVAAEIGRGMDRYKVVVNKSTVPVGTGEIVREVISRHQPRPMEFDVVSNPEFLREGSAIEDTLRPDRIVIGAPTQQVAMTLVELYAPLERPMIITDLPSAEVIKYASNAFLATKISFINAIANICEAAGADVTQVMKGMGLDPRIGGAFLQAGLGYGARASPRTSTRSPTRRASSATISSSCGRWRTSIASAPRTSWRASARPSARSTTRWWPCWVWPSSPTPTTCARPRASRSSISSTRRARASGPMTPWPWTMLGPSCPPASPSRARRTRRPRGRTPPCSSRSGTSSSTSTSSASAASCAAPSSSTGATSTSRSACAGSASSTTPSDASPSCRP